MINYACNIRTTIKEASKVKFSAIVHLNTCHAHYEYPVNYRNWSEDDFGAISKTQPHYIPLYWHVSILLTISFQTN